MAMVGLSSANGSGHGLSSKHRLMLLPPSSHVVGANTINTFQKDEGRLS